MYEYSRAKSDCAFVHNIYKKYILFLLDLSFVTYATSITYSITCDASNHSVMNEVALMWLYFILEDGERFHFLIKTFGRISFIV